MSTQTQSIVTSFTGFYQYRQRRRRKKKRGKPNTATLDNNYDREKYREMILDAAETVLGSLGFDRSIYGNFKRNKIRKQWYEELREERTRDIQAEMVE